MNQIKMIDLRTNPFTFLNTECLGFRFAIWGADPIVSLSFCCNGLSICDQNKKKSWKYLGLNNSVFKNNLELIDSRMDELLAHMMIYYHRDGIYKWSDRIRILEEKDPMQFANTSTYVYKIKQLLLAISLGMRPDIPWDGNDSFAEPLVVISQMGEKMVFDPYHRNDLADYLLRSLD